MAARSTPDSVAAGGGTKSAIREAAVKLFGDKGFEQTSLREVADAVGITKASLYYHYASKLDLLHAIIDPIVDNLRSVVVDLDRTPRDSAGIRDVLRSYLRGMVHHRAAGALVLRDTVTIINAVADRHPDLVDDDQTLREWLAGPNATDEARLRASAALAMLGVALMSREFAPGADDALVEATLLDAATCVLNPRDCA
ncbi:TetR family transcriptional regulator [Nocardia tenerifensis]|uniref:TetR family transcriptional regulator n=1 Tax=Nocardia tenerifensis TaxID=228006 RepID=A0A318KMD2_9NOCA|nr:TetR/AcrR family transcriptional regulator [Nocardia tenerifensis]PXX63165.1 TetR family transcriptional regulator [Nocardia tenerifensis]